VQKAEGRMKKAEGKRQKAAGPLPRQATPPAAPSPIANRKSRIPWLLAAALVLVTLVSYWPTTRFGFLVVDDIDLNANPYVLKGLSWKGITWPLFNIVDGGWAVHAWSHTLAIQVFGLNPWGHHLLSVLVHALNAALVFAWLQQMTGATWRSLMVAALFAVHPLRVEPVAWVTERRELLGAFFGFLSLIAYARYVKEKSEGSPKAEGSLSNLATANTRHATRFYLLSAGFYAFGMVNKPNQISWPFVMLLLDYWPLRRWDVSTLHAARSSGLRLVREKIPLFILTAVDSAQGMLTQRLGHNLEWGRDNPLGARLGNAVVSYGWYLKKLFWPADLGMFYQHPGYWPLGKVVLVGGYW
jgi:protein O-mannosyl-transferase